MILPTKGIAPDQALLAIGAKLLGHIDEPKTVSRLWADFGSAQAGSSGVSFDWFVLALDLLFLLGLVELVGGRLHRAQPVSEVEG
ncbi:MAG: hypothetical protein AMXMBFR64_39570 [Myxococcales bacterium]